jgi:uncharacterized membrane protein YeaQ/YmgE (transglycosylase-associated protein family)
MLNASLRRKCGMGTIMGLMAWLVAGGVVGWLASIIVGRNGQMGLFGYIAAGLVGAFLGGTLWGWITNGGFDFSFNLVSFLVALIGAIVVLAVYNLFFGNR